MKNGQQQRLNRNYEILEGEDFLKNYLIGKELGRSNARVFEAKNKKDYSRTAIKEIRLSDDADTSTVKNEISLLKKIQEKDLHNYFVKFLNFCIIREEIDNYNSTVTAYILMEKCFCSLTQIINSRKKNPYTYLYFSLDEILKIFKQLIDAFAFLQDELSLSHCDIKPENLLIMNENDLEFKVCDVGAGDILKKDQHTKTKTIKGTIPFMAPELLNENLFSKKSCNPFKADVFSLGLCLIYIITFKKFSKNDRQDLNKEVFQEIISEWISEANSLLGNEDLRSFLIEMLEIDPNLRPDFSELKEKIKNNINLVSPTISISEEVHNRTSWTLNNEDLNNSYIAIGEEGMSPERKDKKFIIKNKIDHFKSLHWPPATFSNRSNLNIREINKNGINGENVSSLNKSQQKLNPKSLSPVKIMKTPFKKGSMEEYNNNESSETSKIYLDQKKGRKIENFRNSSSHKNFSIYLKDSKDIEEVKGVEIKKSSFGKKSSSKFDQMYKIDTSINNESIIIFKNISKTQPINLELVKNLEVLKDIDLINKIGSPDKLDLTNQTDSLTKIDSPTKMDSPNKGSPNKIESPNRRTRQKILSSVSELAKKTVNGMNYPPKDTVLVMNNNSYSNNNNLIKKNEILSHTINPINISNITNFPNPLNFVTNISNTTSSIALKKNEIHLLKNENLIHYKQPKRVIEGKKLTPLLLPEVAFSKINRLSGPNYTPLTIGPILSEDNKIYRKKSFFPNDKLLERRNIIININSFNNFLKRQERNIHSAIEKKINLVFNRKLDEEEFRSICSSIPLIKCLKQLMIDFFINESLSYLNDGISNCTELVSLILNCKERNPNENLNNIFKYQNNSFYATNNSDKFNYEPFIQKLNLSILNLLHISHIQLNFDKLNDMNKHFSKLLNNFQQMKKLISLKISCKYLNMSDSYLHLALSEIVKLENLEVFEIFCENNLITEELFNSLPCFPEKLKRLTLNFAYNKINFSEIKSSNLSFPPNLQTLILDFEGNTIGNGIILLLSEINKLKSLLTLHLNFAETKLLTSSFFDFTNEIVNICQIESLALNIKGNKNLSESCIVNLCKIIRKNFANLRFLELNFLYLDISIVCLRNFLNFVYYMCCLKLEFFNLFIFRNLTKTSLNEIINLDNKEFKFDSWISYPDLKEIKIFLKFKREKKDFFFTVIYFLK